jgi:hypothetical protein
VSFGPFENGEYTYAADLWSSLPDNSLTVVDFFSAGVLLRCTSAVLPALYSNSGSGRCLTHIGREGGPAPLKVDQQIDPADHKLIIASQDLRP